MSGADIPVGYGQLSIVNNIAGVHNALNIFGVKLTDVPDQGNFDTAVNDILTAYRVVLSTGSSAQAAHLLYNLVGTPQVLDSIAGHGVGARSDAMLPPNCTALASKTTAFAGKAFRGRAYFPCVRENQVGDAGNIVSAETDIFQALADAITDALTGGPIFDEHVLLHEVTVAVPSPPPPTTVTSFNVQSVIATQRRRMPR